MADVEVRGAGWSVEVRIDGSGEPVQVPDGLLDALSVHLNGIIGALWVAPDRAGQDAIALQRHAELSSEAIAAALLAADRRLPRWVVGDGSDLTASVDDMLGPPQSTALVAAALSAAADGGPALGEAIRAHVSPGLVLPRAASELESTVSSLLDRNELDGPTLLCVLAMHAAGQLAAGCPDRLAREFSRAWVRWAWEADERRDDAGLERLRLPADLLARAVDPTVLTEAVMQTTDAPAGWMERLQRIAEQAGHPRLIRQVARLAPVMTEASNEVLRAALEQVARLGEPQRLTEALRFVLGALRAAGRTDELEAMTDHALALSDGSDSSRAMLLVQFGSATKDARMPAAYLTKVGDNAAEWEQRLPDELRLMMATERCTALRMMGRAAEARAILAPMLDIPLDPENRWRLELNLAMIDRDVGAADRALAMTEDLLARAPDDDCRFLAHQSLARTTTALGMQPDSIRHLQAAIVLAVGQHSHHAPVLRAHLAAMLAAAGDAAGTLSELERLEQDGLPAQAALGAADAVTVLLEQGVELQGATVDQAGERLVAVHDIARENGDLTVQGSALRIRARLHELLGELDDAAADWEALLALYRDPLALASLATLRGATGRVEDARALMVQIPGALLDEHQGVSDIGAILDTTGRVQAGLRQLSTVMMGGRPAPQDVRLAAELSRDAIGRVRAWASADARPRSRNALAAGLPDGALRSLAPVRGVLWVLEWWEAAQGVVSLLSRIGNQRELTIRALPAMPVDAPAVADEVLARLQGWWPDRPGDPLEHSGWQQLVPWLRTAMQDAGDADHLVVIENPRLAGLPWHAIDAVPWTISYAPSWSALLDLPEQQTSPRRIGFIAVPARNDAATTIRAFDEAESEIRAGAQRRRLELAIVTGLQADTSSVLNLLSTADIATVLCHGLIDPVQRELALLLASDGQLPSQHPIAAASPHGRAHRLNWRALQAIERGPTVVLSGACSTGQGLFGGMGERLGLFGALRSRGTRSVIAPAWDAVAADVVTQLAEVRSLLLDGMPAGAAVKQVGDRQATRLPAWRARTLCLEGNGDDAVRERQLRHRPPGPEDRSLTLAARHALLRRGVERGPIAEQMRERMITAGVDAAQISHAQELLAADVSLMEDAALAILQTGWEEPSTRPTVTGAFGAANTKLPVVEAALIAIVAVYGMWLTATKGRRSQHTVIRRKADGSWEQEQEIEWYGPSGPLRAITGLFGAPGDLPAEAENPELPGSESRQLPNPDSED